MTAIESRQETGKIVSLAEEHRQADNLYVDAIKRLARNRMAVLGVVIILLLILTAIFADYIAPKSYEAQVLTDNNAAPQWVIDIFPIMKSIEDGGYVKVSNEYLLGADDLGRDILSRIIYGSRISLAIAFVGPLVSMLLGLPLGLIAGYFGGRTDNIIMRIVDIFMTLPFILMALIMAAVLTPVIGRSLLPSIIALISFGWMGYARIIRGDILSVKERDFVLAARVVGVRDSRILFRHILPNAIFPTLVLASLGIGDVVLSFAALSFLGIGTQVGYADWGQVLSFSRNWITSLGNYWYIVVWPGITLVLFVMGWNLVGDAMRDVLDPRMRGKS